MNINIKRLAKKTLRKVTRKDYLPYLPKSADASDIYLVSYPKSGNTWLRFLLASYCYKSLDLPVIPNWFTIGSIIPDIHVGQSLKSNNILKQYYGSRIIKSHAHFTRDYKRVIYISRNPEDAIASCHSYYKKLGYVRSDMPFSEFCNHKQWGIQKWNEHVQGWLGKFISNNEVRCFSYEELLENTKVTLAAIVDILGLPVVEEYLDYAVENSSIKNMRKSEQKHGSQVKRDTNEESFIGKPGAGSSKARITQDEIDYVKSKTAEARALISRLGIEGYS